MLKQKKVQNILNHDTIFFFQMFCAIELSFSPKKEEFVHFSSIYKKEIKNAELIKHSKEPNEFMIGEVTTVSLTKQGKGTRLIGSTMQSSISEYSATI